MKTQTGEHAVGCWLAVLRGESQEMAVLRRESQEVVAAG